MNRLISILFSLLISLLSFGQENDNIDNKSILSLPNGEAEIGLQVLIPSGSFQQNMEGNAGGGLVGKYYHRLGSKFMLGGELNLVCLSHNDYEIELPNGELGELHESEEMWGAMIGARFNFMGNAVFRTYTEARVGANTFYTSVTSCDENLQQYEEHKRHGTSFVSSLGLGMSFDPKGILKGKAGGHWVTVKGAYVAGTNVSYRNAPESFTRTPINYHVFNSPIGYFEVGISVSKQFR